MTGDANYRGWVVNVTPALKILLMYTAIVDRIPESAFLR